MSVLVYAESWKGSFRKSTYEVTSYAKELAKKIESDLIAISFGEVSQEELSKLAKYGVNRVVSYNNINKGDNQIASKLIASEAQQSEYIVFSNTYTSKMIAPRVSVKLQACIVSNVITIPVSFSPLTVKRTSFSSKAIELVEVNTSNVILSIAPNSFYLKESETECMIENKDISEKGDITFDKEEISSEKISLSEAEIVVSAGRGLKGPENWNMIEELAEELGAATACSKPVSDIGWRPHSEHVGQTGKLVSANLYIAIGISGAIQHLAGVNSSKVMVAINTDAEAPFFKAADYGIIGDAFEVVPKLIEEVKKLKN